MRKGRGPEDDRLPQPIFDYLIQHEHEADLSAGLKQQIDLVRATDPDKAPALMKSPAVIKGLKDFGAVPWERDAGRVAERIRRGAWDEIDRDALVELLRDLSVAIRSRYDEPAAAAKKALGQVFDALSRPGLGSVDGFYGLKIDRLYRPAREALCKECLLYLEARKEAARRWRADKDFDVRRFLRDRFGREGLSTIERLIPVGAKTPRALRAALNLNTRNKLPRRSSKPLR